MEPNRLAGLLLAVITPAVAASERPLTPQELSFFEKRVRPVLAEYCYECHSAEHKTKGGLRLDTAAATRRGGDSGEVIVPGKPNESLFIIAIRHEDDDLEMPRKKLADRHIADLTKWVAMGAPDPRVDKGADDKVAERIDYEEGRKFWSFQAPVKPPVPEVKNSSWPKGDLDRYVLSAMEKKNLEPVADARKRSLVRRIYFDLTGLPPTVEQIDAFLQDDSRQAVAKLVDTLLASPHFGERWGRHWLDVARYSESNGMERNFTYPYAWRYRDYVIESFNRDKPYDQFIREQIAGDLLDDGDAPGTTPEQRLTATGFLAIGPKILNERDKETFQMEMVDEQIDATSRAVLGLTVSCARCHDHKFDPIGIKDYYSLAGIFTSTRTLYGTKGGGGNRQASGLMPIGEDSEKLEQQRKEHDRKVAATQKKLTTTTKQLQNLKKRPAKPKGKSKGPSMDAMRKKAADLRAEVAKLRKNAPPAPNYAMGVSESGSPSDCRICLRGDPKKRGPVVERGYLPVINVDSAPEIAKEESGRRQFASWLVSADNPLAARVMVNRIWHHLFGTGIVRTVDNFGKMGEAPVSQELLDYLAVRAIEHGWSVKKMIREVMLSRTYQLSTDHHAGNYEIDPENRHNWQMTHRRLDAEAIRDAILFASGDLDPEPFRGSVVQQLGNVNFGQQVRNFRGKGEEVKRHRSVYQPILRNAVPEALRVFDFAEPSLIVGRRNLTTVPTQALYLLNDPFVLEQSERMARSLIESGKTGGDRVDLAYLRTLGRPATTLERERSMELVNDIAGQLGSGDKAELERLSWATLCQSLLASAEFRYLD